MKYVKIDKVKPNPNNPRVIKDDKFRKLVKSIEEFPDMLNKRPLVVFTDVDDKYVVLGGNMRLKALNELKYDKVPIIIADEWTAEQKNEFLIKDNVGFGEWEWEELRNGWDVEQLADWGLDVPPDLLTDEEEIYTKKIDAPIYEPKEEKPSLNELFDNQKTNEILTEIEQSNVNIEVKEFLKLAAMRHVIFDYEKIAEFYAHSDSDIQTLFEKSALVIIDFQQAIENGYVQLSNKILEQYGEEHND